MKIKKRIIMKAIKSFFTYFVGTISVLGAFMAGYFYFFDTDTIEIEVRVIDKMRLDTHNVENLTIKYLYQDSIEVNNVWTMRYVISNVGSKTIIAKGNNSNILLEYLPITIENSIQILSFEIASSNFPVTKRREGSKILLDFQQWRRNEYIDIVALIQSKNDIEPFISINDRDIIDAEIIFSEYRPAEINANRKLIDYFPRGLATFLKWTIIIGISLIVIGLIWTAYSQIKEEVNAKSSTFFSILMFIGWLIVILLFCAPLLWIF